jgi:hypothetical protein
MLSISLNLTGYEPGKCSNVYLQPLLIRLNPMACQKFS